MKFNTKVILVVLVLVIIAWGLCLADIVTWIVPAFFHLVQLTHLAAMFFTKMGFRYD